MKKYRLYLLLVGLIVSFVLASYGVPAAASKEPPPGVISCFTWSSGSQSYFVSAGMSEVVGKYSPIKIAVEPTAGPPAWLPLLRRKQGDMGVMTILDAYDSYYGIGIQKHGPQPIRLLLTSYSSHLLALQHAEHVVDGLLKVHVNSSVLQPKVDEPLLH